MTFRIEDCIRFSFIPSIVYLLAILRTSHTWETILWSLWWAFLTVFARITANHKTLYKRSPDWWERWNARLLFSSTFVCVLYACNVPYAWAGCIVLRASSYKTLSFLGFVTWAVLVVSGVCTFDYWPCIFLLMAVTKQWAEKERCNPVIYWSRRSIVTFLHQEMRWCIWCKAVFPHVVRQDVTVLAWLITAVIMMHRWIMYIPPKKVFIYKSMPPTHVPAPSIETALACSVCKPLVQIDDEERMYDSSSTRVERKVVKKVKKQERQEAHNPMFSKPDIRHTAYTQQDVQQYVGQIATQPIQEDVCDFI